MAKTTKTSTKKLATKTGAKAKVKKTVATKGSKLGKVVGSIKNKGSKTAYSRNAA